MPYKNYIYEYYAKISSGEIIVGKWIKKIFEIIINGLQTQEYFFNAKAANKAIKFIETFCHHSKGRNDLITLELWQKAIVSTIFGIQDAEKIRVFREIFIVIGRKNGKSLFASALIAYMAYLEPEYGQEIYCLAPKLDQAALVYDGFYQMVQAEEELEELAKKRRSDIYIAESNTVIKPIAFNAKKSDGFNPQLVVCDEMAAWSGDAGLKQYEVSGMIIYDNKFSDLKQVESKPYTPNALQMQHIQENVCTHFGTNMDILQNKFDENTWNAYYEGKIEPFAIQLSLVMTNMSFTERERACGNAIFFSANRLQYASNATKLSVSTQLFDRALLNRNGVMDIWNMAHVEDGEKYYIRKEYTEVKVGN